VSTFGSAARGTSITSANIVDWDGAKELRRDNYYITEESTPARRSSEWHAVPHQRINGAESAGAGLLLLGVGRRDVALRRRHRRRPRFAGHRLWTAA
jgi:hypothetical protein